MQEDAKMISGFGKFFQVKKEHPIILHAGIYSVTCDHPCFFVEWSSPPWAEGYFQTGPAYIYIENVDNEVTPSSKVRLSSVYRYKDFSFYRLVEKEGQWVMEELEEIKEKPKSP